MIKEKYDITLPQFEGPFDLLLFFIERDELDIYDIPIAKITKDFLDYINEQERLNIELSSDFMLFASRLIQIKVKMLFPRKEIDEQGNEIDPREDFINQLVAYKRYKEIASALSLKEADRMQMVIRGNSMQEITDVGKKEAEESQSELHTLTMGKLIKAFERVLLKVKQRTYSDHIVTRFNYSMEECKETLSSRIATEKRLSFDKLFDQCENRVHAIFYFLSLLEIVQLSIAKIFIGEGRNNFLVEYTGEHV